MSDADFRRLEEIKQLKYEKILDLMRRATANPENMKEVAKEISVDWNPAIRVHTDGKYEFIVGSGRKT